MSNPSMPAIVGDRTTRSPVVCSGCCSATRTCRTSSRFSVPFFVAEVFTGTPGQYVSIADTIKGFKMILDGECDDLAENDLYMKGGIDMAIEANKNG